MRFPLILTGAWLLATQAACGDTVPSRARTAAADGTSAASPRRGQNQEEPTASAPRVARSASVTGGDAPEALPAPVVAAATPVEGRTAAFGALENRAALKHFYDALAQLDAGQSHDDVGVLVFGDSHIAADFETGPLRRTLQARFGDGGRGFVALGNPWKHYVQEGLRNGNTGDWAPLHAKPTRHGFVGDGYFGLDGFALHTTHGGARAWGDYTARTSRVEVAYLAQPRGGSFDVYVDGARAAHVSSRSSGVQSAWRSVPLGGSDGTHRVEVVASGDGDVRLFGAILDRDRVGVTLDALGINGARVTNALAWDERHMAEQIKHRDPDLVVLAYGTNESGDTDVPIETYERELVDLLGRVARAAPTASCLLVGPPDRGIRTTEGWGTLPRLLDVIATQRRVARAAGCAFFDQLEAMGGPGTIAQWAEEPQPRANRDRVHLTRAGYAQLADAIAGELIHGYDAWRASPQAPQPPAPPQQAPIDPNDAVSTTHDVDVRSLPTLPMR